MLIKAVDNVSERIDLLTRGMLSVRMFDYGLINNGNVTSRSCIYREMQTSASKIITPSKNASLGQV